MLDSPPFLLQDDDTHHDVQITGQDYAGRTLHRVEFDEVLFTDCNFAGTKLLECRFTGCRFVNCDLSSGSIAGSTLDGVRFEQCRLLGVDFSAANDLLIELEFHGSQLDYCCFSRMGLTGTPFLGCRMHEVDLSEAKLDRSVFTNSDLSGANFTRATLVRADLRSALNLELDPSTVKLNRTRIDLPTQLLIGKRMGLQTDVG